MSKAQGIAQSANQGQFKNRIINGSMTIFQRGTSIAPTAGGAYALDRWLTYASSGTSAVTQSTDAPAGFSNSFLWTTTTGGTRNSNDYYEFAQFIEGFNFSDMMWGTANAQPITLSFWVKSSVTGTFSVLFRNSAASRSYVTTYSINTANTWEYKTITITGDITGTWVGATNGKGLEIWWDLGSGSTYQTSSLNTWLNNASTSLASTSQAAVGSVTGATFRITGVQLEKGSTATSFDYRPYGTELALCQRYYQVFYGNSPGLGFMGRISAPNTGNGYGINVSLQATMRADPTVTRLGTWSVINSNQPNFYGDTKTVNIYSQSNNSGDTFFYANDATKGFTASAEL